MSILEDDNQLLFFWKEFSSDTSYAKKKAQGVERLAFHCMLKQYHLDSNYSILSVLDLNGHVICPLYCYKNFKLIYLSQ